MDWRARVERLSTHMDHQEELLSLLEVRDDKIYRSVYGLDEIPPEVRGSGIGGENRYEKLAGTSLEAVVRRQDIIEKRAYVQSKSFDDITILQNSAGDMAAHIPAIPPMSTDRNTYHMSSPFGFRSDPLLGYTKRHTGMDFACPPGNPIYATGDGVVVKVAHERKGYGNHVEIDHGFGYKTRYAHMSEIFVEEGQKLLRGDCIGLSGKSGRITGPHLHYEIMYRKDYVNPALYMDLDISPKDYYELVRRPEGK
jgi:murein DD-endopeptidase MepM/ murein hydrolase activator NlpD